MTKPGELAEGCALCGRDASDGIQISTSVGVSSFTLPMEAEACQQCLAELFASELRAKAANKGALHISKVPLSQERPPPSVAASCTPENAQFQVAITEGPANGPLEPITVRSLVGEPLPNENAPPIPESFNGDPVAHLRGLLFFANGDTCVMSRGGAMVSTSSALSAMSAMNRIVQKLIAMEDCGIRLFRQL